jgi:hypothetical protein
MQSMDAGNQDKFEEMKKYTRTWHCVYQYSVLLAGCIRGCILSLLDFHYHYLFSLPTESFLPPFLLYLFSDRKIYDATSS